MVFSTRFNKILIVVNVGIYNDEILYWAENWIKSKFLVFLKQEDADNKSNVQGGIIHVSQ